MYTCIHNTYYIEFYSQKYIICITIIGVNMKKKEIIFYREQFFRCHQSSQGHGNLRQSIPAALKLFSSTPLWVSDTSYSECFKKMHLLQFFALAIIHIYVPAITCQL